MWTAQNVDNFFFYLLGKNIFEGANNKEHLTKTYLMTFLWFQSKTRQMLLKPFSYCISKIQYALLPSCDHQHKTALFSRWCWVLSSPSPSRSRGSTRGRGAAAPTSSHEQPAGGGGEEKKGTEPHINTRTWIYLPTHRTSLKLFYMPVQKIPRKTLNLCQNDDSCQVTTSNQWINRSSCNLIIDKLWMCSFTVKVCGLLLSMHHNLEAWVLNW